MSCILPSAEDLITPETPTDEELHAFFKENADRYQPPPLLTFTHVFADPDKRGDATLEDAKKLKEELGDEYKPHRIKYKKLSR